MLEIYSDTAELIAQTLKLHLLLYLIVASQTSRDNKAASSNCGGKASVNMAELMPDRILRTNRFPNDYHIAPNYFGWLSLIRLSTLIHGLRPCAFYIS